MGDDPRASEHVEATGALDEFLASPWVGTTVAVLGVTTGLLGSIYTDELKKMIQALAAITPREGAWLFVACVIATALAVFFRQRVIDKKRELVQQRFDAAAEDIPELIRTLPEQNFQHEFGIVFEKSAVMIRNLVDLETRADGVTVLLQGFATLASKFDAGRRDDRFAANLMVYLSGASKEPWLRTLKFFDRDPKSLAGVLALPAEFAAVADDHDKTIPEFALPVPADIGRSREEPGGEGYRILPGAPLAYARNRFEHYAATSALGQWCRDYGDFTEREKGQLNEYFATLADQIAGFMSIPIREPTTAYTPDAERRVLGVLNIHWDRCDRLSNAHSAKLFAAATFPLQVLLAQVLLELLNERPPRPDSPLSKPPPSTSFH